MSNSSNLNQESMSTLIDICNANIKNSEACMKYLTNRGISESDIEKYKIGYFPQNVRKLIEYVPKEILIKNKIMSIMNSSKFADEYSLIIPIFDEYNNAIGISGRTLLDEYQRGVYSMAKYENSSYKKTNILYGLNNSRSSILQKKNVYVVEGYFDYISMINAGGTNTVAICGTAFSRNHLVKLAKYTNKMTFILDKDDGGILSMKRICDKYSNKGINLLFRLVPDDYKDVDEYFTKNKNKNIDHLLRESKEFLPGW